MEQAPPVMRQITLAFDYLTIGQLLEFVAEPNRTACQQILAEHRPLFERAWGSTHNHQTWEGGYIDHVTDAMNFARHEFEFIKAFGRPLPFAMSDALLILFLHDLEKPWRILVSEQGKASNREGLSTKEEFKKWWFRFLIVVYAIGIVVLPLSIILQATGQDEWCYSGLTLYKYGSLEYNQELVQCAQFGTEYRNEGLLEAAIVTPFVHYLTQFIFFKIIIGFIVLGTQKRKERLK